MVLSYHAWSLVWYGTSVLFDVVFVVVETKSEALGFERPCPTVRTSSLLPHIDTSPNKDKGMRIDRRKDYVLLVQLKRATKSF